MDIRCPSCSTLYEPGDDAAAQGDTARCAACGQEFKLRRGDETPPEQWRVRHHGTGEVLRFDDFTTLQRWIVDEKLTRADEISKSGDDWTSLGEINELKAYFRVVDELNAPPPGTQPPVAAKPPEITEKVTGAHATADELPDVRPARQSQPVHVSKVEEALARIDARKQGKIPLSVGIGASSAGDPAGLGFSGPAMRTDAPLLDVDKAGGSKKGSRWPTVVLGLLLIGAVGVILVGVLRPELLGLVHAGDVTDQDAVATAEVGTSEDAVAATTDVPDASEEGSGTAEGSAGAAVALAEGSAAGSGAGATADGSGTAVAATTDAAAPAADAAAPPTRDTAPTQVAARDTTPQRETVREPERQPEPERTPEREREPEREPERSGPSGFDELMAAGNAALDAGDGAEALRHFTAAADERSSNAEAQVGVARAYEALGRYDRAAERYERATRANARYTPAWMGLAESRQRSGDTSGACEAYARVKTIVRQGRWADRAQAAMDEIGCE